MAFVQDHQLMSVQPDSVSHQLTQIREMVSAGQDPKQIMHLVQQAEAQCRFAGEFVQIAELALQVGDLDYADDLFQQAEDFCLQPNEFAELGRSLYLNTQQKQRAECLLRKAVDLSVVAEDTLVFARYAKIDFQHDGLAEQFIYKAISCAQNTNGLLNLVDPIEAIQESSGIVISVLDLAEEAAGSIDDINRLFMAVDQFTPEDYQRKVRIKQKLELITGDQLRLDAYKEKEKELVGYAPILRLAKEVGEEMDAPGYVAHLLSRAEGILETQPFHLERYRELILLVDNLLQDDDWVIRLLNDCKEKINFFIQIQTMGDMASSQLKNCDNGLEWARELYQEWAARLDAEENPDAYDYSKLARSVHKSLGDRRWAVTLLKKAAELSVSHHELGRLGHYASQWGEQNLAESFYRKAAETCVEATHFTELVRLLRSFDVSEALQRELYSMGEQKLNEPISILRWAEGIVREFADKEWAVRIYEALRPGFEDQKTWAIYNYSRKYWIDFKCSGKLY